MNKYSYTRIKVGGTYDTATEYTLDDEGSITRSLMRAVMTAFPGRKVSIQQYGLNLDICIDGDALTSGEKTTLDTVVTDYKNGTG